MCVTASPESVTELLLARRQKIGRLSCILSSPRNLLQAVILRIRCGIRQREFIYRKTQRPLRCACIESASLCISVQAFELAVSQDAIFCCKVRATLWLVSDGFGVVVQNLINEEGLSFCMQRLFRRQDISVEVGGLSFFHFVSSRSLICRKTS